MFTLKNAKRVLFSEALEDELTRERGNEIARQFNMPVRDRPLPVWRQEPQETTVDLNLPGPSKAGLYSLLVSAGFGLSNVFVYGARTCIYVLGRLALWGGGLFLLTLAFRLWGWL